MTTYPTNIKVLDKDLTNTVMEEGSVSPQTLYELYIPAGTLDINSRLRIKATISRVQGTPLTESDVTCIPCSESGRAATQQLSEAGILTPRTTMLTAQGSFSYVGEYNNQHEIYQAIYNVDYPITDILDNDRNLRVYRFRGQWFRQVARVLTTTFDDLDIGDVSLVNGIADEPTYGMVAIVSISSNAPDGFYLYKINGRTQVSCPAYGQFYAPFYCYADSCIYLTERNTYYIRKFNEAGGLLVSNTSVTNTYGNFLAMHVLGSYVWILTTDNKIVRLNVSDLTLDTVYDLSPLTACLALFVVSDTVVYVSYGTPDVLGISAFNPTNGEITEIDSAITLSESIGFGTHSVLHFKAAEGKQGYFYTTSSPPFSSYSYNAIMKIGPVDCP